MKRFFIVIFLIFYSFFAARTVLAQNTENNFEVLMPEQGLSNSVTTCMLQDELGFMWFGTLDGLNCYNGYNFETFHANDSLEHTISGNYIRSIYEDENRNLWIGTEENGLNLFNRELRVFESFDTSNHKSLRSNKIIAILEDSYGTLWVGTDNGLCIFDRKTKKFVKPPKELSQIHENSNIKSIFEDTAKNLWIGTSNGLYKINTSRSSFKRFQKKEERNNSLSNNEIHCVFQDNEGNILIGTSSGLNIYNQQENRITQISEEASGKIDLSTSEIYSIAEDKTGNLWFGTFGSGLVRWNSKNGETTVYTINPLHKNSISNDFILSLLIDKSGLLWVGTYGGGVNKLNLVKINFGVIAVDRTAPTTLISNEVYAIFEDSNRNLWIGTEFGISVLNKIEGRFYNIVAGEESGMQSDIVYSILGDHKGNIWIGTNGGGLYFITQEKILNEEFYFEKLSVENTQQSLLDDDILCLFEDEQKTLWIGTTNGLNTYNHSTGEWKQFVAEENNSNSIAGNNVQCVFQDSKGSIWVGTDNGLSYFNKQNQSFQSFQYNSDDSTSIPNNNIYSINEDKEGLLWIGSDGGLTMHVKGSEKFRTFTYKQGLPDNVIYGILIDNENNLWVSTNNGLSKLIHGSNLENYSFVNYNSSNWLHCDDFNIGAFYKNRNGVLYFGCNKGITYFHPDNIKGNLYEPPVYITNFKLFYEDVPIEPDGSSPLKKHIAFTHEIVLNYSQDIISFEFAALNYIQSEKNNYAFRLENFNDEWVYPKENNRSVTYTNLDPGEYTFSVRGSNNNGIWNKDGAALKIIIKPPFWKTWWFYVICVVGAIVIFYIYVHVRTHKLRMQRKILEEKVKERTEEVLTQKEELETALENLKKTQTQLVDKEKMASLGQLTAGVAHEINNPINFVSGNVAPLERDIKDVLSILSKYEEVVKNNNINDVFRPVEEFKKELDYDFLKTEINDLIKGIKEGAHRTSEIVKSLRSFSRLDENDLKVADINKGLESTLLILRNKLKNRIEVVKDFGDIPEVYCYPGKINQVFMNILTNAEQAIIGEGKIIIKTTYENGKVKISIKDNGVGMPEDVKNRVFDPFFTTKDVGDGTGLGLSISFGIIETHNGSIAVNSMPGEGTEFIITLPERMDS